ncbi:MerR family transcriptional regulator [Candidatus Dependentiae bacterium]|nr:MerR family transcriptional regulator [Candidatus Dependentiae bacterium]
MKRRKGFYSISVVAKMFEVHQQTIRLYEKEGLITPHRSEGNTRQFTEEDVDQLEKIIHLTHKLGINLAGVEMILKLQKKIDRLQGEINKAFDMTKDELEKDAEILAVSAQDDSRQLIALKKGSTQPTPLLEKLTERAKKQSITKPKKSPVEQEISDDLKIDYEDL